MRPGRLRYIFLRHDEPLWFRSSHPKEVRWAAAEAVSEDVIAAVLLLHERSVDEIVPKLSSAEL
jgi:hypothetical protein